MDPVVHKNIGRKILKDSTSLLGSSLWSQLLGAGVGFVTARILGPADFALLKIISYVPSLAKFGSFGFDGVVQREVLHARGMGAAPHVEQRIKDTGFIADLMWSIFLAIVVLCASFFNKEPVIRYGLWLASITLVLSQVGRLYAVVATVDKRFGLIAQANAFGTTINSIVVLSTVYWGRIFSVMAGLLLGACAAIFWYRSRTKLDLKWNPGKTEFFHQTHIALPLAGGTLAFGLFGWVERIQIIALFGREMMGVYMLSVMFYEAGLLLVSTLLRASSAHLYQRLGGAEGDAMSVSGLILKPSLALVALLITFGGMGCILAPPVISWLLPAYSEVVSLFPWVVAMLAVRGATAMAGTAMNSTRLNMQTHFMIMWLVTTAVFYGGNWLGFYMGYGIGAVAASKTLAFFIMGVIIVSLTQKHLTFLKQLFRKDAVFVALLALLPLCMLVGFNGYFVAHTIGQVILRSMLYLCLCIPIIFAAAKYTDISLNMFRPM